MGRNSRSGAVYWIDHYVVPTNDLLRWDAFMKNVLGGIPPHKGGLTTAERLRRAPIRTFFHMGRYHDGKRKPFESWARFERGGGIARTGKEYACAV